MKRGRLPFLLGAVFGGIGIVLAVIGVVLTAVTLASLRDAERTDGTVVAVVAKTSTSRDNNGRTQRSTSYYPKVRFGADGRAYTFVSPVGTDPPAYQVGDRVPVAYDAGDPSHARVDTFTSNYLPPMILGGIAVVFLAVGIPLFRSGRARLKRDAWLRRHGREVWADVERVAVDFDTRINGRHPYVVHATWYDTDTGRTHAAVSDQLLEDPGPRLRGHDQVRVLADPDDPDHNVMDLDTTRRSDPVEG